MADRDAKGRFVKGNRLSKKYGRRNRKHGHCRKVNGQVRRSRTYNSWHSMLSNRNHPAYDDIKVCERWTGKNGFVNFLRDLGERPPKTTLDRKNPKRGYYKGNCRWSNGHVQAMNKRESGRAIAMRAWKSRRANAA
jgi:hypothetical protein